MGYRVSKKSIKSARKNGKLGGRPKGVENRKKVIFIGLLTPLI